MALPEVSLLEAQMVKHVAIVPKHFPLAAATTDGEQAVSRHSMPRRVLEVAVASKVSIDGEVAHAAA
jgi:hypothetical protein